MTTNDLARKLATYARLVSGEGYLGKAEAAEMVQTVLDAPSVPAALDALEAKLDTVRHITCAVYHDIREFISHNREQVLV